MAKKEVRFKGRMELTTIVSYLEELVNSIKEGTVYIQQGDEYVALHPVEMMDFEVEASRKKDKEKLTIEVSWKKESTITCEPVLKITSVEPEVPEEENELSHLEAKGYIEEADSDDE